MFSNYLKIAIRNLLKNKLFSIVNIGGMAISLASFLLIGLYVWDESSYDRYHKDADRTFRIYDINTGDDGIANDYPIVPYPFADYLQKDFPEIESTVRLMDTYSELLFDVKGKRLKEPGGIYAESNVFDMLSLKVVTGDLHSALDKPRAIALSQSLASKYFGDANPIGEMIRIDGNENQVTAVYENPPSHLHVKANFLLSLAAITKDSKTLPDNWQFQQFFTYLKLKPGTDANALESKLVPFVNKYASDVFKAKGFHYTPYLQNIKDIHLYSSSFQWDIASHGNIQSIYILSLTGVFLLIIACLNFVNLSTARAIKRMKEVGVRKVIGAQRRQLILQFISESVVITALGLLLAIGICELALPFLNSFAVKDLTLPLQPLAIAAAIGFCILVGMAAGSYPAFYLSRFRPIRVLYSSRGQTGETSWFRQSLVVLQFMFSFFLIIGSLIVISQNDLLRNKDIGFSREQLITIPLRREQLAQQESTKREFMNHPNVTNATICFGLPGEIAAGDEVIDPTTKKVLMSTLYCVDEDYIQTMNMHVIAGRDFSVDISSDKNHGFLINETAVKTFGLGTPEKAIGKSLDWKIWGKDSIKHATVLGVVKDFNYKSLRESIAPVVIQIAPQYAYELVVRIKPTDIPATIAHLKKTYERLDPDWIFTYNFVDANYDAMYKSEEKLGGLFTVFTVLAIVVACLGLFGLVEYSVNQRSKEISIRKVFGATVRSLLLLLTRRYVGLITIAFILIIPLSYFTATQWLNNFAYHVSIEPQIYLEAGAMVLVVTLATVSFQSLRAALHNPSNNLRNE